MRRLRPCSRPLECQWKINVDASPDALLAFEVDHTVETVHSMSNAAQPEAGWLFVRSEERLGHFRLNRRCDSVSGVANRQADEGRSGSVSLLDLGRDRPECGRFDCQTSSILHRLACVQDQVDENALQLERV